MMFGCISFHFPTFLEAHFLLICPLAHSLITWFWFSFHFSNKFQSFLPYFSVCSKFVPFSSSVSYFIQLFSPMSPPKICLPRSFKIVQIFSPIILSPLCLIYFFSCHCILTDIFLYYLLFIYLLLTFGILL